MDKKWFIIQSVIIVLIVGFGVAIQERRFAAQREVLSNYGRQIAALREEIAKDQNSQSRKRAPGMASLDGTDSSAPTTESKPATEVQERLEKAEKTVEEAAAKVQEMLDTQQHLKELAKDMQDRRAQQQIARTMLARYEKALDNDINTFGRDLYELYKKSLPKEGVMNLFDEASDTAFKELITKYPSAETTAIAVAERALACAARQDTEGAIEYYNMLLNNTSFDTVITSKGVDATPALLGYFASQYVQQGEYDQAQQMLNYLSQQYADSTLALRGPGGEPVYSTVDDFVGRLSSEINRSQR